MFEHPVAGDKDTLILWPCEGFLILFHEHDGAVGRPLADLRFPCGYATRGGYHEDMWFAGE